MTDVTEADIIEERRVPERDEVAAILARYFVASDPEVADRLHAVIVALAADPARLGPTKKSFRANSRRSFGQAWKEELSRGRSLPRMLDLVAWIAMTEPGYPAPKPYCPPELVGRWHQAGYAWRLDADGTAAIDNPILAETRRWCVHRQGDRLAGDALWFYDDVDDQRGLQIEDVGAVLRFTLLDNDVVYELVRDTMRGLACTTDPKRVPREAWPAEQESNRQATIAATELRKLIPKALITGGSFVRAQLAISRFDHATITGTDFTKSDLERSDWTNARVTRATFVGARFGNASLDGATFTACDFREASFAKLQRLPLPTTTARFEDCDLRDTDWTARSLDNTAFVRCKLAGARGTPSSRKQLVVEDCDLAADEFCNDPPVTMQWLVESPRNERAAAAAIAALGAEAAIHRGPVSTAPEIQVRFVFASDLASYLAALPGARACERTILVNAERFEVLDLLEAHDLGGAIECEENGSWTADDARMFVRTETLDLERGTVIGGPGRESEHYVL